MKTAEEKAKEYSNSEGIYNDHGERLLYMGYLAGYKDATRWRDPKEERPELLPNRDYSNNVLAKVEGFTETQVMCLLFAPDGEGGWGYVWGNCYGDINGEAEWDDDYEVVGWKPIE